MGDDEERGVLAKFERVRRKPGVPEGAGVLAEALTGGIASGLLGAAVIIFMKAEKKPPKNEKENDE